MGKRRKYRIEYENVDGWKVPVPWGVQTEPLYDALIHALRNPDMEVQINRMYGDNGVSTYICFIVTTISTDDFRVDYKFKYSSYYQSVGIYLDAFFVKNLGKFQVSEARDIQMRLHIEMVTGE